MKQKRTGKLLSLLLAGAMAVSMIPAALASNEASEEPSQPSIENFKKVREYERFGDVEENAWYFNDLRGAYEMGLINGGNGKMNPGGNITLAEVITLGSNVYHIYKNDDYTPGGSPWYQNAVDYAKANYLIPSEGFSNYTAPATRGVVARIFANSIFPSDLPRINRISWIPDVTSTTRYRTQIYALYNAGVLAGSDGGAFRPGTHITRAETAAIMNRLVDPDKRVKFSLTGSAPGTPAESKDGTVRVSYNPDAGWTMTPGEYKENESDSMTFSHKDGGAQIEIRIDYKSAAPDATMAGLSNSAAQQVTEQGDTLDSNPYSAWLHGLSGYTFEYHHVTEDGTTVNGEFSCVENSGSFVSTRVSYTSGCADEVMDQMWDIYNSLDLAL